MPLTAAPEVGQCHCAGQHDVVAAAQSQASRDDCMQTALYCSSCKGLGQHQFKDSCVSPEPEQISNKMHFGPWWVAHEALSLCQSTAKMDGQQQVPHKCSSLQALHGVESCRPLQGVWDKQRH